MSGPIDELGAATLRVWGLSGIGEVHAGDDVATHVLDGASRAETDLADGDVVAVSSKIVSKSLGLAVKAANRDDAIAEQTVRIVAERLGPRGTTRIVRSRSGPVLAAAGVDASNVDVGTVLVLPLDPDAAARDLRRALTERTGRRIAVVITDTMGRPWRDGQVDVALGAAGLVVAEDMRGRTDRYGNLLEVTVRAAADEIAALADLVKGKLVDRPAAVVRGLGAFVTQEDGPGVAALLREGDADWFRYGHLEAVRAAVGAPPGTPGIEPAPMLPGSARERLLRAVHVALASPHWAVEPDVDVRPDGDGAVAEVPVLPDADTAQLLALGALAQRVAALAAAEGLDVLLEPYDAERRRIRVLGRTLPTGHATGEEIPR
jgi:coenzyme F420-0:L-glutamate ligase / coenzyme F420-1:gamma-L-glutamate ligase